MRHTNKPVYFFAAPKVNTISSVLKILAFYLLGEHESRVIFLVKGNNGIETLALFALEAFEQFRMSVGEQVLDFFIGQGAFCLQPKHGQPALRVVAADDLTVELHPSRSALGTLAAGVTAAEQFVA